MGLWSVFKRLSQRVRLYDQLRYSRFYHWLLKYKNPAYTRSLNADLAFYRDAVGASLDLVFDVGANHGDKAWAFKQLARTVVCVEPDRNAFAALRTRYGRDAGVRLENVALGDREGTATFYVDADGSCYNTLSEKQKDWLRSSAGRGELGTDTVPVSTLDALIAKYGVPDFLKVDVEGYESEVFGGLTHQIAVVSFEANLPRFRAETLGVIERLAREPSARFNLRSGDGFVFPSHVDRERIREALCTEEEVTYDVFVYYNRS